MRIWHVQLWRWLWLVQQLSEVLPHSPKQREKCKCQAKFHILKKPGRAREIEREQGRGQGRGSQEQTKASICISSVHKFSLHYFSSGALFRHFPFAFRLPYFEQLLLLLFECVCLFFVFSRVFLYVFPIPKYLRRSLFVYLWHLIRFHWQLLNLLLLLCCFH